MNKPQSAYRPVSHGTPREVGVPESFTRSSSFRMAVPMASGFLGLALGGPLGGFWGVVAGAAGGWVFNAIQHHTLADRAGK